MVADRDPAGSRLRHGLATTRLPFRPVNAAARRELRLTLALTGGVADHGTHGELMALGGLDAELYTLQCEQSA